MCNSCAQGCPHPFFFWFSLFVASQNDNHRVRASAPQELGLCQPAQGRGSADQVATTHVLIALADCCLFCCVLFLLCFSTQGPHRFFQPDGPRKSAHTHVKLVFSLRKENNKQRHHLFAGKLHQGRYLLGPLISGPSKSPSLMPGPV